MRLIIASVPRAGSTYMLRSVLGMEQGNNTPPEIFKQRKPFHYPVVKTHSKAEDVLHDGYKAIFLYRDPIECVISTRINRWDRNHFRNCGVDKNPEESDIYTEDVLHYEDIWNSWMKNNGYEVMTLKYDSLCKHFEEINNFVGKKIDFLPWKQPKSNIDKVTSVEYSQICKTYKNFMANVYMSNEVEYYH